MKRNEERPFGFMTIVLLGINAIIGSGIFLLPGQVMNLSGHWSWLVYLFVTLLVLSIAWCFAQCASLYDRNGGAYVYAKEAFGAFIGFEIGLMRWVVGILAWAALVVGFVTALSTIWPAVLEEPFRSVVILLIVGFLGLLNILGMSLFKHLNNLVAVAKIMPLMIFVLGGVFFLNHAHFKPLQLNEIESESFGAASLLLFYAYGGFETLVVVAGEMKNPRKNMPSAVLLAIAICSSIYFMIQLVAVGLLGEALSESIAPLVDSAHFLIGNSGRWFVTIAMLISIGGVNLAASFIAPRSGAALAEDGLVPKWLAHKGRYGTPVGAILVTIGLTGFVALSGSFVQLIVMSVVSRFSQYFTTCLAVYVLHRKRGASLSLMKRVLIRVVPIFALTGLSWMLLQATTVQVAGGLGAMLFAVPLYWRQKKMWKAANG